MLSNFPLVSVVIAGQVLDFYGDRIPALKQMGRVFHPDFSRNLWK